MRPSQRKARREREAMLKNVGGAAAVIAGIGGVAAAACVVNKKKKAGKVEDQLTDIVSGE